MRRGPAPRGLRGKRPRACGTTPRAHAPRPECAGEGLREGEVAELGPSFRKEAAVSEPESQHHGGRAVSNPPVEGIRRIMAKAAATGSAADFLPERLSLPQLREAAAGCR